MNEAPQSPATVNMREQALSRWDNEGGAVSNGAIAHAPAVASTHPLSDAELVHLRVRVIALENIVLALLAAGPERQRDQASEIAEIIRPREGAVQHPLTLEAAQLIDNMVERSKHFATAVN